MACHEIRLARSQGEGDMSCVGEQATDDCHRQLASRRLTATARRMPLHVNGCEVFPFSEPADCCDSGLAGWGDGEGAGAGSWAGWSMVGNW